MTKFVTVKEVAETLGMCETMVRRMAKSGKIRSYRLSAQALRFDMDEVIADAKAMKNAAPQRKGRGIRPAIQRERQTSTSNK